MKTKILGRVQKFFQKIQLRNYEYESSHSSDFEPKFKNRKGSLRSIRRCWNIDKCNYFK